MEAEALGHCGTEVRVEQVQVLLIGGGQVGGGASWPVTCAECSCGQQGVLERVGLVVVANTSQELVVEGEEGEVSISWVLERAEVVVVDIFWELVGVVVVAGIFWELVEEEGVVEVWAHTFRLLEEHIPVTFHSS